MEGRVYQWSTFCVTVSQTVADVLRAKGYAKPTYVVPMAVDPGVCREPIPNRRRDPQKVSLGFVGRLVPEKGVDVLLEALAKLAPGSVKLTVVGGGPEEGRLRTLASCLGVSHHVRWLGPMPAAEVSEAYKAMDVLVVPSKTTSSWREQFGRVVIEAGVCGVKSIVSDSGELPNVVSQIGHGWIVREGDSEKLASQIDVVMRRGHLERDEAERVRGAVVDRFSEEVVARRLANVLGARNLD
jgi:glycosyltransferase involved in cell wall biosynthesis